MRRQFPEQGAAIVMEPIHPEDVEPAGAPDSTVPSDRELLERFIKHRDDRAFDCLVRLHGPLVLGACRRIVGHHHDAEEAFQATFMVLARKAASVRPPEMLANWLYGVACRTSLKMKTSAAKRRAKEVRLTVNPEAKAPQSGGWDEIAPLFDRELSRLPEKYRAAVVSCDLEGRSRHDAARQLGWPEGTLKVRLMRARSILANRLAKQGVVLSIGALAAVVSQNAATAAVPVELATSTVKAAGALAAAKAAPAAAIGTKAAVLSKGGLKSVLVGKAALATSAVGAVGAAAVATVLFVATEQKTAPPPTMNLGLSADIRQALEENAKQLSPITITGTMQFQMQSPPADAPKPPNGSDKKDTLRIVWQDQKVFASREFHYLAQVGRTPVSGKSEFTFDGRVFSAGHSVDGTPGAIAPAPPRAQGAAGKNQARPVQLPNTSLVRQPVANILKSRMNFAGFVEPYFAAGTGLIFALDSQGVSENGQIVEQKLHAESAILNLLQKDGGKLISVEQAPLDGKPCVRIELDGENPFRVNAESFDLESQQRLLKQVQENRNRVYDPQQQRQMLENLQNTVMRIEAGRKLPATCRYTYYLDPALHYAVRRFEQRYLPDTLLSRINLSDFQQVPGRSLWLPRRVETLINPFDNTGGKLANELGPRTLVQEVASIDGNQVPDETFALNYTAPGTTITEWTNSGTGTEKQAAPLTYTIPARSEDLPRVIEQARQRAANPNVMRFGGGAFADVAALGPRQGALIAIGIFNVAMLGMGAAYLVWRSRKEGAT